MEVRLLSWFLFILCTQCLTCLGFEGFPRSKVEDFNLTEQKFGDQLHVKRTAANISIGLYAEIERRRLEGKHEITFERKGQKGGKGTYGGGNPARHPRSNKGPASLSSSICFVSTAIRYISLATFMVVLLLGAF